MEIITKNPEETKKIGRTLAKYVKPGDVILLYGALGTGKTTLIQGLAEGLEVNPDIYVTSPTFAIVNIYEGKIPILHLDLYRLESEDIEDLGLWEYGSNSVIVIEWADRLSKIYWEDFLEIHMDYLNGQGRVISFVGYGEWSELLKALGKDEELALLL